MKQNYQKERVKRNGRSKKKDMTRRNEITSGAKEYFYISNREQGRQTKNNNQK